MKKVFLLLIFAVIFTAGSYAVNKPNIVLLGSRNVNFVLEKDVIPVAPYEGMFSKLMFKVQGNAVEITKLMVTYGNGDTQELPVKWIFQKGDWSREIDLKGDKRLIKKIVFHYKTVGRMIRGKARLSVYGLR
jgi:hypothetical protein